MGDARALRWASTGTRIAALCLLMVVLPLGGSPNRPRRRAQPVVVALPAWSSPRAVSKVFAVSGVAESECTLRGGRLGGPAPCKRPSRGFADAGVDALLDAMAAHGEAFTRLISGGEVVVVAVDTRCADGGTGSGRGRLATSTDVVKGVVWSILQRPGGFSGEVVVAGESPLSASGFGTTPANAGDRGQSLADVVRAFARLGYPVSLVDWRRVAGRRVEAGALEGAGIPDGEYARGDLEDALIVLARARPGGGDLAYPKFRTAGGRMVSLRYGLWGGDRYLPERLRLIDLAVLTADGALGARGAWANLAGIGAVEPPSAEAVGGWLARIRAPDLNLVDAMWVGDDTCNGAAIRRDTLLCGTDPFALDWYASEYVLYPAVAFWPDTSAARAGRFREVCRRAQHAAAAAWGGGAFPWMVFEGPGSDAPSREEREQLDVYVVGEGGGLFEDGFDSDGSGLWSEVVR